MRRGPEVLTTSLSRLRARATGESRQSATGLAKNLPGVWFELVRAEGVRLNVLLGRGATELNDIALSVHLCDLSDKIVPHSECLRDFAPVFAALHTLRLQGSCQY